MSLDKYERTKTVWYKVAELEHGIKKGLESKMASIVEI